MWLLNPIARAVIGHGAYKMVSASGLAIASTPIAGSGGAVFDGSTATSNGFVSNEAGAGCVGVSYVGQNFVTPYELRRVDVWSGYNADVGYTSTSQKLQYSMDGSTWVDHSIFDTGTSVTQLTFYLQRSVKAPQWRVICNATPNAGGNRWGLTELQMWVML